MARAGSADLPDDGSEIFFVMGLDRKLLICPTGKNPIPSSFRGTRSVSFDVQLHIRESITTIGSMDSGLVLRTPRNDEGECCGARLNHRPTN
jgi:hypothetical protein